MIYCTERILYEIKIHLLDTILASGAAQAAENGSVAGLVIFILITISISFLCSILEAVILTSSSSHIQVLAEQGQRSGILMLKHKANVEQPISAILTLNTIAHTVGAAGAGAQAAAIFGNEWLGVISAILTFLILVFSEIIPKTLGAFYWKPLIPFAAYTIQVLLIILYPAVKGFDYLSQMLAPEEDGKEPTVTRSELEILAQIGSGEGILDESESIILKNLFQLNKARVNDIMTPRTVMFAMDEEMTVGEALQKNPIMTFSRIPVYKASLDEITGFILRYHLLSAAAEDRENVKVKQLALPIHSVPETLPVLKVLQEFITRQEHIFLILDEYGGTSGVVTMEDAMESLLGVEITDESDVVEDLRILAKQRYERQIQVLEALEKKRTATAS